MTVQDCSAAVGSGRSADRSVAYFISRGGVQSRAIASLLIVAALATCAGGSGPAAEDPCRLVAVDEAKGEPRPAPPGGEVVLVTGGSGFIGSHLVARLLDLGYTVRVLDSLETGNIVYLDLSHPKLEFVYGNILDLGVLETAMKGASGVFHLGAASKVLPSLKDPVMATFNVERNAVGTSRVLQAANATGQVKKVVYAASSTYYGNQPAPFHEDARFVSSSPYASSKYMGELGMQDADLVYGLPTLSLRFFMVYGPRNPEEGAYAIVTGRFAKRAQEGKPLLIEGSGEQFRDFVHADDVARACILAYQSSARGSVVNIGSGVAYSVKDVANLVSTKQQHVAARRNDLNGTLADTCRARSLLNFKARHDFVTTIKDMLKTPPEVSPASWRSSHSLQTLEQKLPGWAKANSASERGRLVKARLDDDDAHAQKFIDELIGAMRQGQTSSGASEL